ncbi:hypothetical protein MHI27_22420 [Paenibacillus sp. FSL H8-0261]|uniref:hypothetical protein n=1 Tax=Paenibacillus sp. FSL H8-0261 TaxID=2921381 RepID=UPI003249272F
MNKAKKTFITTLSMMTLILAPAQSIFADEAVNNSSIQQQEVQNLSSDSVALRGQVSYSLGTTSTSIYLNGSVTIQIDAGIYDYYSIDIYDANGSNVLAYDPGNLSAGPHTFTHNGFYGYHKILVRGFQNNGSYKVIWP